MGAVLLVFTIRARRTDRERAALLLCGGALVGTGLVISLGQGIIHPYYTVALAPPLAGLVGIGTMGLWQRRSTWAGRICLAAALLATSVWGFVLLDRTPDWFPFLRFVVLVAGILGAVAILALPWLRHTPETGRRPGGGTGPGCRPGRALVLHRRHGGHAPLGRHPFGHADARRRRWFRGGGGFGRGAAGFGRGGAGGGGGFPGLRGGTGTGRPARAPARAPAPAPVAGLPAASLVRERAAAPPQAGSGAVGFPAVDSAGEQQGGSRWWSAAASSTPAARARP